MSSAAITEPAKAVPALTKNEHLKQRVPTLAGTIAATLAERARRVHPGP